MIPIQVSIPSHSVISFGSAKSLDDITLDDVLKYPVWLWVWETGNDGGSGQDETWQQPVISTAEVTAEMTEPIITFRVKGTDIIGSGSYDPRAEKLFGMALWIDNSWQMLSASTLSPPLIFVAVPPIRGATDVDFICENLASDEAFRRT